MTAEEIAEVGAAVDRENLDASTWPDALPQIVKLQADMVRADFAQWNTVAQLSELAKDTLVALAEGFDVPYEHYCKRLLFTVQTVHARLAERRDENGTTHATAGTVVVTT